MYMSTGIKCYFASYHPDAVGDKKVAMLWTLSSRSILSRCGNKRHMGHY